MTEKALQRIVLDRPAGTVTMTVCADGIGTIYEKTVRIKPEKALKWAYTRLVPGMRITSTPFKWIPEEEEIDGAERTVEVHGMRAG